MAKRLIRQIVVDGNIAYVPLTRNQTAIIDAEDVPLVEGWNWTAVLRHDGKTYYAARNHYLGGGRRDKRHEYVRMHRVIAGATADVMVDHEDGNGLNNRKKNLRPATPFQNQQNCGIRRDNKSGFKGVSWHKAANAWVATITVNGKRKHLGVFPTAEAAHSAYLAVATEEFGQFMRVS